MVTGRDHTALSALVQGFIFTIKTEGKAHSTIDFLEGNLRRFLWYNVEHGWPDDIHAVDAWKIREFLSYAGTARCRWGIAGNGSESSRNPSTTNGWRYYRTLRRFFNWTVAEGFLVENPLSKINMKPPKEKPVQPYVPEEIGKLVAVCDYDIKNGSRFLGARNKAIIFMFLAGGPRLSELANLRLQDLNLEGGRARVLRKGSEEGVIGFDSTTRKALWKYLLFRKERGKKSEETADWLWLTEEGTRLTVPGLQIAFRRIKKRAGVNSPGAVHRLRHTWALNTLRQIKDPFLLQLLLGHKDLTMTRRYTMGLKIEEALAALDRASPVERLGLR